METMNHHRLATEIYARMIADRANRMGSTFDQTAMRLGAEAAIAASKMFSDVWERSKDK